MDSSKISGQGPQHVYEKGAPASKEKSAHKARFTTIRERALNTSSGKVKSLVKRASIKGSHPKAGAVFQKTSKAK